MKVGIVGLGLIGGSIAKALHPFHHPIIAVDSRMDSISLALKEGVIEEGYVTPVASLFSCDIIYINLYPQATLDFIVAHKNDFQPHTVITDVSGIKHHFYQKLDELYDIGINLVLGHPMAGSELSGYDHATATLFHGTNYLIMPHPKNAEESLQLVERLATQMGCRHVTRLSMESHDSLIAYVSHLPHVIAASLLLCPEDLGNLHGLVGRSFIDMTRIGAMNETLWAELLIQNKDHVGSYIDHFIGSLRQFQEAIQSANQDQLTALLQKSKKQRSDVHD